MSHYAWVVDGIVRDVIVAEQDFIDHLNKHGCEPYPLGQGQWIQTSYNTRAGIHYGANGVPDDYPPTRKNFAAVGCIYDSTRDAFYAPSPFPSWILDEDTCIWHAPIAPPDDQYRIWNESTQAWELPNG